MNNELLTVINYLERDRGIDREVLIQAVEFALQSAARKTLGASGEIRIEIDRKTFDIKAFEMFEISDTPSGKQQVSTEKAREIRPGAQPGEHIELPVAPKGLGRIAAQTAKQAIMQRIRQAERENVYEAYKDRAGDIVSGSVRQVIRGDILVELGRAEAIIPHGERVPSEDYQPGDRIRAYVLQVQNNPAGPSIVLSRSAPDFVKALFRFEVSEVAEGMVEMMAIARDPGYRTKIAVRSHDEKIDPVGACVGMRGSRVKNIVRELNGEKIDIVRWSDDARTFATQALAPARLASITLDPDRPDTLRVIVESDQLSLAIGKRGQNVRLASILVNHRIDIQKLDSEMSFEEQVAQAVEHLSRIEGIDREQALILVQNGFLTPEGIIEVEVGDLVEGAGLDEATANLIWNAAAAAVGAQGDDAIA